jgi:hypothetical protein
LFTALTGEKARSILNVPFSPRADNKTPGNGWEFSMNKIDGKTSLPKGTRLKYLIDWHSDKYVLDLEGNSGRQVSDCSSHQEFFDYEKDEGE